MSLLPEREFLETLPRRRLAAGAMMWDEQGRIGLAIPTYKEQLIPVGGTVEPGESPAAALLREGYEELGIELNVGRLLCLEHTPTTEHDDHGATMYLYDCGTLTAEQIGRFVHPLDELSGVRWVERANLSQWLSTRTARRVEAAWRARDEGTTVELGR